MRMIGLSLVLAGTLMASEYSYEISPMIGGVKPEGNLDIDSQKAYGLRFQVNDWSLLGLVPELSFDRTTSTDYDPNVGDTTINRYAFNGLYDFRAFSETVTPYLLIGIGYEDVSDEKLGYDSSAYGNYGAGVKWKVYEDIALRAEVKHLLRTDDGGNELYYGVGLSIPFGEKASEQPMKEEKEEVAPVTAVILDGDKDGVLDNADKCPTTPAGRTVDPQGCEFDGDKDGVVDGLDKCPATPAGRTVNAKGCELDGDKDGVVDALDKCPNTKAGNTVDVNGCAESVVLAITFENASAKIDTANSPQLKKYAEFMKLNTEYDVTIIGHTDSRGSAAFNKTLSTKRALSVKNDLVSRGVEASRIQTLGSGEEEPVADNATAEGRAQNRRIEAQLKLQQ